MEYLLLAIVLAEGGYIIHLKAKKQKSVEPTIEEKELARLKRVEKEYQKLFNYSEAVATRGYKDEE